MSLEFPGISKKQAFLWISLYTFLISGISWGSFFGYHFFSKKWSTDSQYKIVALIQTGPEKEALKTECLAEILGLSVDQTVNLYQFSLNSAKKRLLRFPIIKEVSLKKIFPGSVHIDYTIRQPVAFLGDYSNTVLDEDGVLLPFTPFFTPKNLPEVYFGMEHQPSHSLWGKKLEGKKFELALQLIHLIHTNLCLDGSKLKQLDLSASFHPSEGKRQIVILFENHYQEGLSTSHVIRLGTKNYLEGLSNYRLVCEYMRQHPEIGSKRRQVIDLRVPKLGFIEVKNE